MSAGCRFSEASTARHGLAQALSMAGRQTLPSLRLEMPCWQKPKTGYIRIGCRTETLADICDPLRWRTGLKRQVRRQTRSPAIQRGSISVRSAAGGMGVAHAASAIRCGLEGANARRSPCRRLHRTRSKETERALTRDIGAGLVSVVAGVMLQR